MLVLAAAQALASVLAVAVILLLIYEVFFHTRETLALLVLCAIMQMIEHAPGACLGFVGLVIVVDLIVRLRQDRP